MSEVDKIKEIKTINKLKNHIKNHKTVKRMFEEYGADIDDLKYIPVCFKDLDVSARTERGIVYLNKDILEEPFENDHYLVHEILHVLQQCWGDKATRSSDVGSYLDNEYEKEAFQKQTEYIAKTKGEDEAEDYVENLLDYHEVDEEEKGEKKDELLSTASFKIFKIASIDYPIKMNQKKGYVLKYITPDDFIKYSKNFNVFKEINKINEEKKLILSGKKSEPLIINSLYDTVGIHKAYAAKEVGINKIPVLFKVK